MTSFRNALRAITSTTSCDVDTENVRTLEDNYSRLDSKTIIREIELVPSRIARFRVVRYLPASCRSYILRSGILNPRSEKVSSSIMTGKRSLRHTLAAQCSSLAMEWDDPEGSPLVSKGIQKLRDVYARLLIDAPDAVELPTTLGRLVNEGSDVLKQLRNTVALIGVDESLDVVEETLCAQWAQLRNIASSIMSHMPRARKFLLDFDVRRAKDLFHACDFTRRMIVNRDVELPDLRAPLGAGNARRLLPFAQPLQKPENDADDDSDEWEDPVELSADELDISDAPVPAVANVSEATDYKPHSLVGLLTPAATPSVIDGAQVRQGSKYPTTDVGAGSRRRGKLASHHNTTILDALEASNRPPENSSSDTKRKRGKKIEENSVRDRLRAKLGIKKKRRSSVDI